MDYMREFTSGGQAKWTKDEILAGLQKYYKDNDHYPTAHEIDSYPYLPSSRSIQRSYGGLVNLRKELIPEGHHDHTKGQYRSDLARKADIRARQYEEAFFDLLIRHFQEISVHEHKVIRPGGVASDFFIYLTEQTGIVIDLFYAKDIKTLMGVVNIKLRKYEPLPYEVYFILVANSMISQNDIDSKLANRVNEFPDNIKVVTSDIFSLKVIPKLIQRSEYVY